MIGQSLDHVYGAMLPAGASQRDGQITAVVTPERRQPFFDETADVLQQFGCFGLLFHEGTDRRVLAGQMPQTGIVIGIRQAPDIEHDVCIEWNAEFETE